MSEPMTAAQLVEMVTVRAGYTSSVGTACCSPNRGGIHLALDRRSDLIATFRRTRPMKVAPTQYLMLNKTDQDGLIVGAPRDA